MTDMQNPAAACPCFVDRPAAACAVCTMTDIQNPAADCASAAHITREAQRIALGLCLVCLLLVALILQAEKQKVYTQ